MNKRLLICLLLLNNVLYSATLLDSTKSFFKYTDDREDQVAHLKNDFAKFQGQASEQSKLLQTKIDQTNTAISTIKNQLKEKPQDQEFLNKKLALLNEIHQKQFNIQFLYKEIGGTFEQNIKLLEEFKKDPGFKDLALEARSFYSFDMVQNVNKKLAHQEDVIAQITAQKNDSLAELETRKKKLITATKEYQEKKKQQEEFKGKTTIPQTADQTRLNFNQRGELLDHEQELAYYEKILSELRLQEITRRVSLINTKLFIETEKLKIFKENLDKAKSGLHILPEDIETINTALAKKKQESLAIKDRLYEEIKELSSQRDKLQKDFNQLLKRYNISTTQVVAWSIEPKTVEAYSRQSELGLHQIQLALLNQKIDYLRAQIDGEEINFKQQDMNFAIMNTWYKISQRKFRNTQELQGELKRFKDLEAEINREFSLFTDKRNAATNLLGAQNKELSDIRSFKQALDREKELLFKRYPLRYESLIKVVADAEKSLVEQIDVTTKLIDAYSTVIAKLSGMLKELTFILSELETKSIWQRSEYAISWHGVKNIGNDLSYFIRDIKRIGVLYSNQLRWPLLLESLKNILKSPAHLGMILFLLLCMLILFVFLRTGLPRIKNKILSKVSDKRLLPWSYALLACVSEFTSAHAVSLVIWLTLWGLVYFEFITSLLLHIVFYLASIIYLIYLSTMFAYHIIEFNRRKSFVLFSKSMEKRLLIVLLLFSYTTAIVLFFREAFMLATIHKSELPRILLAGYSIFLRTLIIFSIGKEEIIALLHNRSPFWNFVATIIDRYYYVLLLSIVVLMIISDPYVGGYGNLVSFLLWGLIGTLVIVKIIMMCYAYAKRWSAQLFFYSDEEVIKERFAHAKTSYGLFILASLIVFITIGIVIGLRVWSIPITMKDVTYILNAQLFETGIDKVTNQIIWFTPLKLLSVIAFIVGGFILALAINRFVFRLVFDILPVDLGVQNTVVSISRYLIVVIAIYLGFQWGGLGTLLLAIGVVIGSIGYIVKEPIGDFVSYFIILVQRPIQIGDFIVIDEENQGVVRNITPRSVILRRKDSYTIIVPNSMILSRPINNWNYARNFSAFDDIELTIPYQFEPQQVKEIIIRVLDRSLDVLKSPKPIIRLNEFGEYGFVFKIRGFISDINIPRKWDIASDIRFDLVKELRENGIKIAIPTRMLVQS